MSDYDACAMDAHLTELSRLYYLGTPAVSDHEFDRALAKHRVMLAVMPNSFPKDSILHRVSEAAMTGRNVRHMQPMLSLDNVFETGDSKVEQLNSWLEAIHKVWGEVTMILEDKVDGLAFSVRYGNGMLASATSRGNGEVGDNFVENFIAAELVPTVIRGSGPHDFPEVPQILEVRGEVYLTHEAFEWLNHKQQQAGEDLYANPRNAAAGIIRRDDAARVKDCGLQFVVHGLVADGIKLYSDAMAWLNGLGFRTLRRVRFTADCRFESSAAVRDALGKAPYPVDGAVVKVDATDMCEMLGQTSKFPKWAIALKYQQPAVVTRVSGIIVQVGRSGALTPVAELVPVLIDGTEVSRATLHNEDEVNRKHVSVGDEVEVRKAGAIIPEVVLSVSHAERLAFGSTPLPPFSLLDHIGHECPSCGSTDIRKQLTESGDGSRYCCMNEECPARLAAKIEHTASRDCLDIEMLGGEAADALAKLDGIVSIWDVLHLPELQFAQLSWITDTGGKMTLGASRAEKITTAIAAASTLPLSRWLFAAGIPSVGKNTSREISRLFRSADELRESCLLESGLIARIAKGEGKNSGELAAYGVSSHLGPASCKHLVAFFSGAGGGRACTEMMTAGIVSDNFAPTPAAAAPSAGALSGKTVVVTGVLSVPRRDVESMVVAAGGKLGGSVSKKTSFLVAGEDCGGKLDKAKQLGVSILTEAEFRALL